MCGPELMRILIDEKRLEWDDAWNIVTQVVSYTNNTILPEALEKRPVGTFSRSVCARPPSCGTARFAWPICP